MARKSDWTPPTEPSRSAAILPGVPLPDWALSGEPFLPELDIPDVHIAGVGNEPSAPARDLNELNLDDLSIADMEAALRDFSAQISATPVAIATAATGFGAPEPQLQGPTTSSPFLDDLLAAPEVIPETTEDDEQAPPPIEFAVPGYPQTPAAPQVQMPLERPGYPDVVRSGPITITPPAGPALVIPPPPPPPLVAPHPDSSQAVEATAPVEPIRLDLPMSAVLAREFTRTTPWESGHRAAAAPVPVVEPTMVPASDPLPVATPQRVPAPVPVLIPEPAIADEAITSTVEAFTPTPTTLPETVEPAEELAPAKQASGSRRLLMLIGLGAALAILAAAAAFFLPGILNPTDTPAVSPSASTASNATPSPSTAAPIAPANFVLQTPDTIGDMNRLSGPIDLSLRAATTASAIPGLTKAVSAVYGTGTVPQATVIAWHAATAPAATSVSQAFAGFQSSAKTTVTNVSGVSSTGLPGQMSCGETTINATPTTLCFWADPATFGSITVVAPKTPAEGALTAAQIRSSVEYQK